MVQKGTSIITTDPQRGLCQIICAEGEKLSLGSEIIRADRGPRQFHHGTDQIVDLLSRRSHDRCGLLINHSLAQCNLFSSRRQWHHDFRNRGRTLGSNGTGCLKNGARLHPAYFRIGNGKPASTMAKHRIGFCQFQRPLPGGLAGHASCLGNIGKLLSRMW